MTKDLSKNSSILILNRANLFFFIIGSFLLIQFTKFDRAAYFSFVLGWLFVVLNLFLLQKIGAFLLDIMSGIKINPIFFGFLLAKFCFWGLVIATFHYVNKVQGIPFLLGTLSLVFSGLTLGVKEFLYARTP